MKPHQLIAALMAKKGLGELPLARAVGAKKLQAPIYRFIRGEVPSPKNSTAQPLADFFDLPLEAIYNEKTATAIAKERGISESDIPVLTPRKTRAQQQPVDEDVMSLAKQLQKLSPVERQRLQQLMNEAQPVPRQVTHLKPEPEKQRIPSPLIGNVDQLKPTKPAKEVQHGSRRKNR